MRKDINSNSTTVAPPVEQCHIGSNGHSSDVEGNQVCCFCLRAGSVTVYRALLIPDMKGLGQNTINLIKLY